VIALAIFVPALVFSHTFVLDAMIAVISLLVMIELLKCVKVADKYLICVPSCAVAFIVPLLLRYIRKEMIALIAVAYIFYLLYAAVFARKRVSTGDIALSLFSAVYVTLAFSSILVARDSEYGAVLYFMIFIGAWITDTFAYFTGRLFGRHKLMPDISPKKTVEGAIGGAIFCALAFVLYGFILSQVFDVASPLSRATAYNYILLACIGVAVSVFAQLGDLSASAIKRNYGVKDFGAIFPGHGGFLDRFDSVMAVAPVIMIIGALFTAFEERGLFM
jgi:phosphatidate cytidylyltransferase